MKRYSIQAPAELKPLVKRAMKRSKIRRVGELLLKLVSDYLNGEKK